MNKEVSMIIQRKPNNMIGSIVDVLWYVDERDLDEKHRKDIIVPSGHIHIVYNFADSYFLIEENRYYPIPDRVLVGQFKNAVQIKYGNHVKQLGIAIHPLALYSLFHQVSGLYTEAMIDCSDMPSMELMHNAIMKIVSDPADATEILDEVEKYFESYDYVKSNVELYEHMVSYLEERKGIIDVKEMAGFFGYSVSALERNFKKHVGLTPKAYADILRFRYTMIEDDPKSLFYDQSHFIKNCRKYTNKIYADLLQSEEISLLHMLDMPRK